MFRSPYYLRESAIRALARFTQGRWRELFRSNATVGIVELRLEDFVEPFEREMRSRTY